LRKELLAFVAFSVLCLVGPFVSYSLPSMIARVVLIILFLGPILWTMSFTVRPNYKANAKIAGAITCFVTPVFMFLLRNINRFLPFLEGLEISETHMLALEYSKVGFIDLSAIPHSPFFQTPYLVYVVSTACGIPIYFSELILILFYFAFIGCISYFILKVLLKIVDTRLPYLPYLLVFSLVSASSLMYTAVQYRYIGSLFLPLLVFLILRKSLKAEISYHVLFLLLVLGITLGDPISSLLMIPLFLLFSLFQKDLTISTYALIPLSYLIYNGWQYLAFLKSYFTFAWNGINIFIQQIFLGKVPERVVPWQRVLSISIEDSYVASAAYISLLILMSSICVFSLASFLKRTKDLNKQNKNENKLIRASNFFLSLILLVIVATYVGVSVQPEVTFSDIRTIVLGYSTFLLLFAFASKAWLSTIASSKILTIFIVVFLLFSSFRIVFQNYPKSSQDPILTLEDNRMDLRQAGYANIFLYSYYQNSSVIRDYKTSYCDVRFLVTVPNGLLIIGSSLNTCVSNLIESDLWVYDRNGLYYNSFYIPSNVYSIVYEMSLNRHCIYNNGAFVIYSQTR
jgi:hypothetical protein